LRFFRRTPADLREHIRSFDIVVVGGGNTRSMLAVWRDWEFAAVLREAYEAGTILCGWSAGSICWFEHGVTDSIAGPLTAMPALGFLAGSNCPHYDGEKERRPAYHRLVAEGAMPAGYGCDDGAALHFAGERLNAVISARPGAFAYHVERDGRQAVERRLDALLL
jgi:peptidase E